MINPYQYQSKLLEMPTLIEYVRHIREVKATFVFTNGCFDVIHKGHIHYLRESRKLGDYLIVGINSDQSVKKLKGENRPLNTMMDRVAVLEAFDFVDRLIVFEDDTPLNLILAIEPDVYTKGGDYNLSNIIGSGLGKEIVEGYGGKVMLISSLEGVSSTNLIRKIGV